MQGWNRQTLAFPTGAAEGSSNLVTRAADGSPSPNQHPARHAGPFHVVEDVVDVVVDVVVVAVEVGVGAAGISPQVKLRLLELEVVDDELVSCDGSVPWPLPEV